jgi:hypothetical protein
MPADEVAITPAMLLKHAAGIDAVSAEVAQPSRLATRCGWKTQPTESCAQSYQR